MQRIINDLILLTKIKPKYKNVYNCHACLRFAIIYAKDNSKAGYFMSRIVRQLSSGSPNQGGCTVTEDG